MDQRQLVVRLEQSLELGDDFRVERLLEGRPVVQIEDRIDRVGIIDEVVREPRSLRGSPLLGLAQLMEEILVAQPLAAVFAPEDDLAAAEEDPAFMEILIAEVGRQVFPPGIGRVLGGPLGVKAHVAKRTAHADEIRRLDPVGSIDIPRCAPIVPPFLGVEAGVLVFSQSDDAGRLAVNRRVGVSQRVFRLPRLVLAVRVPRPLIEPQSVFVRLRGRLAVGLVDQAQAFEPGGSLARVEQARIFDRDANLATEFGAQPVELLVAGGPEDPGVAAPALFGGVVLGPPSIVGVAIGPAFIICRLGRATWGEQGKHDSGSQDDEILHSAPSP